jgi:NAD(P)-dependent dehydrogenase (short-subunit alcohol dehydrogenase family)
MVEIDLSGQVAVVTGGSRGLGLEIARGLSRAGAIVAIASRNIASCETVVAELIANDNDKQASAHAFDAGSWEDCDRLFAEVNARWGGAQILVNNVGKSPVAPSSVETSKDLFDKIIAVNLRSTFRLSALFGAHMYAQGSGAIVNISSTGALRPEPNFAPYAAAKMGVSTLTTTFAKEFGSKVRVNTVMPGPFHTDATSAWSHSEGFAKHAQRTFPLQRGGNPSEIVGAVLYLVSDLASFTTGACIAVDGGHAIASASSS